MKHFALTVVFLGLTGCNQSAPTSSAPIKPVNPATNTRSANADSSAMTPDNTAVNARDRDSSAKTPIDQNENQADIDITANIRKRVVDTKMSVNAQNVKIITQDGKVTLRGPVKTADEKHQIEDIAHDVAGADKVDSQIEVEQQP